jgi:hypothetical protein
LIFLILSCLVSSVNAEIIIASGVTSITNGRTSPAIYTGYDSSSFALTLTSVGVKNAIYYQSGYLVSAFSQRDLGTFLWRNVRGGFGGGVYVGRKEYKDGIERQSATDISIGPTIRITWEILPDIFIGVEAHHGLGGYQLLLLTTQRVDMLTFGVRF